MKPLALCFLSLLILSHPSPSHAQVIGQGQQSGAGRTVSGSIAFMGGAATAVQVTVESSNRSINRTLFSDGGGSFTVSGLPVGEYYVTLQARGFITLRQSIDVPPGNGVLVFQFMMRPAPAEGDQPLLGTPISVGTLKVPADARKEFEAGLSEWKKQEIKKARAHFEEALQKHNDYPQALWALAQLDLLAGETRQALERLRKAVGVDPQFYEGHLSLSRLLHEQNDAVESLAEAEKAVGARPDQWEAFYQKGLAALSLNKLDVVEDCAAQVESLGKGKVHDGRLLRAGVLLKRNEPSLAKVELEAFLKAAPKHPSAPFARQILDRIASNSQ